MLRVVCGANIKICITDPCAFKKYPAHNHLYDKLLIARSQDGVICGESTQNPPKYPILVRPRTNLEGMGFGARWVVSPTVIKPHEFWVQPIMGTHRSVDVFVHRDQLLTLCFIGRPGPGFTFRSWSFDSDYKLSPKTSAWLRHHLHGFEGVCNIELIEDTIIECHLRMGDINCFQSKALMQAVLNTYKGNRVTLPVLPSSVHLIPVFLPHALHHVVISAEDIWFCARKSNALSAILNFTIDPKDTANPAGGARLCNFVVSDLRPGEQLRREILTYIENKFCLW
jgi:hypothetical protein